MDATQYLLGYDGQEEEFGWGRIRWLCSDAIRPGAELTFGEVWIEPNKSNPVHSHPNCEEILRVLSGECRHSYGDKWIEMAAGDSIRVPRGVRHNALNMGEGAVHMIVCYSAPDRQTELEE